MGDEFKTFSTGYMARPLEVTAEDLAKERERAYRDIGLLGLGEQTSLDRARARVMDLERKLDAARTELHLAKSLLESKGRVFDPAKVRPELLDELRSMRIGYGPTVELELQRVSSASGRSVGSCSACKRQFVGGARSSGPPAGVFVIDGDVRLALSERRNATDGELELLGERARRREVIREIAASLAVEMRDHVCGCVRDSLAERGRIARG